jgi:hypothetical protein
MHDSPKKGSEILYGREATVEMGARFIQHAKEKMDLFGDNHGVLKCTEIITSI